MFQRVFLAASLALISAPLLAQEDALRAAAERYIEGAGQQKAIDAMLSPESLVGQIRNTNPAISEELASQIGEIAAEELDEVRPELEAAMIEAAVATFTLEEITALDAFYRTPEGAAVLAKMQPFMQTAMSIVAPDLQQAQMQILQRAAQIMQAAPQ